MTNRYEDRTLYDVYAHISPNIIGARKAGARTGVSANVTIQLKAVHDDLPGPTVEVHLGFDDDHQSSLEATERRALVAAVELMQRFVRDGVDGLLQAQQARREHDLQEYKFEFNPSKKDD